MFAIVFTAAIRIPAKDTNEKMVNSALLFERITLLFSRPIILSMHPLLMMSPESDTTTISRIQMLAMPRMPFTTAPLTVPPSMPTRLFTSNNPSDNPITTASTKPTARATKMFTLRNDSPITTSVGTSNANPRGFPSTVC